MRIYTLLILCLFIFCLLVPGAHTQVKSKGNTAVCAISSPYLQVSDIAGGMPSVRKALDMNVTIPLWNAGKTNELILLYKKAIGEAQKKKGPNSIAEAAVQQELGDLYIQKGNYKAAEPAFRKGIQIMQMPPNKKAHQDILYECLEGMGYVHMNNKQFAKATDVFKQSIVLMEREGALTNDPNSEMFAMALDRLADAYIKQNNFLAAEPLLKRSLEMRKKTYGPDGSTTNYVKEQLIAVYEGLRKTLETVKLNNSLIQNKRLSYKDELGPFFAKQVLDVRKSDCILPLISTLGPGSQWNEKKITEEIEKKLDSKPSDACWYKIPNWLAGMWAGRDIPKGAKVKEVDGSLWDDPPPMGFYSGPGPYAFRKGCVQSKDGWWHYDANNAQNSWTQSSRSDSKYLTYVYYQNLSPVTNLDGSIRFRTVVMNFEVKPKNTCNLEKDFLPAGTITRVWQENRVSVYQQLGPNKYALYSCEHVYDWKGTELSTTSDGNKVNKIGSASWQQKIGEAAPINYAGMNLKQELKTFLTQQRMFGDVNALR